MNIQERFDTELHRSFRDWGYGWSHGKEVSCRWIIERVRAGRVLDIGGTRWLLEKLAAAGRSCTFFDAFAPSPPVSPAIRVVTGDMHRVADLLPENSFDQVVMRHSLEHALNPLFVLWQANLLLKEGGRLIVVVPNHRPYWIWFYTHFNCLPAENWKMLFYRAGFALEEEALGYWDNAQSDPYFVEYRFVLRQETRAIRLENPDK